MNITGNMFGQDADLEYQLLPTATGDRPSPQSKQRVSIKLNAESVRRHGATYIIANNQIMPGQQTQVKQGPGLPEIRGWPGANLDHGNR